MSDPTPITGQQARELLAASWGRSWKVRDLAWGVRQGDDLWLATLDAEVGPLPVHWEVPHPRLQECREQMALAAAAPDLAATVVAACATFERIGQIARTNAITARAMGRRNEELLWLDVLDIVDTEGVHDE